MLALTLEEQTDASVILTRFYYFIQHYQAVDAAETFIVPILNSLVPFREQERNIHQEILAETHQCPIDKVICLPLPRSLLFIVVGCLHCLHPFSKTQMLEVPCQIPPFSLLHTMVEKKCWETFNPKQQLSSGAEIHSTSAQELNRRLAWSYDTLSAESFQPQVVSGNPFFPKTARRDDLVTSRVSKAK